ncbi:ClC family H(+)/Cl(-) exchange transporter [Clostridium brassicae]|uniref:ClC family H(+)/Cl(-) exchange transporter n=1 Tax=Clostridium brassicae TaxID=2999072 RepID=A0ABT4D9V2_9CLOT|nr:ClC family H(+)/Cl(-) exchange transporter [Clostridium brassicae]MCY6959098.1 ClC family H(+)/Cl(-) exchange transporter [Clostridium brassicae]
MKEKNKNGIYNTLFHWQNFRFKLVVEGVVIGLLSGLLVVAYRYAAEKSGELTKEIYLNAKGNIGYIILMFVALMVIAYLVGKMVKSEPMASGSGIPQVEGVLLRKLEMNWVSVVIKKFIGGVLALGAGLSVGREGPSVQMGAAIGQGYSRIFKRIKVEEKFLITSGASAGLAAAFNAPLAGVMFALEEVHKNFSPLVLISAMSASLTADFISKQFFGLKPVFSFSKVTALPLKYYFYLIVLGIIIGIFGVIFNNTITKTQDIYNSQRWLPAEFRPVVPFVLAGILGLTLPNLLGGGHKLIEELTKSNFTIHMLVIILVIKFLFTMISYGSGVPGGIFLPLLVIGALIGDIYGVTLTKAINLDPKYVTNFMILAMAGYFTAIVKSPVTGSILITEMTGSFSHLLSLTLVSITAYVVTDILKSGPIYEILLERFLKNNKEDEFVGDSKRKVLLESAVIVGSMVEGKKIRELKWPEKCLLVGIKRGNKELIPKGNTTIYPGDYLIVLVEEDKASQIRDVIVQMSGQCVL